MTLVLLLRKLGKALGTLRRTGTLAVTIVLCLLGLRRTCLWERPLVACVVALSLHTEEILMSDACTQLLVQKTTFQATRGSAV